MDAKEYLKGLVNTTKQVDDWLAGKALVNGTPMLIKYDGELGWLPRDGQVKDGVDGSSSIYSFDVSGARHMTMYADKPCRINTYGNSFTQCAQVNDGETWQEMLAAHLCEPVRNFGVGGYSVYQAYQRMKREEAKTPAEYIIFNIYDDDHYRTLCPCTRMRRVYRGLSVSFTSPYVKVNPSKEEFVECENPCPTRESLYNLCDLDWVYESFRDDFVLKIELDCTNTDEEIPENRWPPIAGHPSFTESALFASKRIVERVEEFAALAGKKVLYVLSYNSATVAKRIREGHRFDQEFVDFLQDKRLPYIDLMEAHIVEFARFKMSITDYLERCYVQYFAGHYNPLGNFFTAFAIKDKLVEMLEPKPISYQNNPKPM